MTTVNGKVVLITGGARGIGEHTARVLASRGARVALIGQEPERLAAVACELGGVWAECDVTDMASLEAAVASVLAATGRLDVVVANAGISSLGTIHSSSAESFRRVIDVNVTGVWQTAKATVDALVASRGYLLVIASVASFTPVPGLAAYAASKSAAEALAFALRGELAPSGVTVGVCHPSWIDTDMLRDAEADLPSFAAMRSSMPWPTDTTTTVAECAVTIADGIARRRRRIWVPGRVRVMPLVRLLVTSRLADRVVRRHATELVPRMDAEVAALGRSLPGRALPPA